MSAKPRRKPISPASPKHAVRDGRAFELIAGDAAGTIPLLDAVIHERARLAIITALAAGDARTHSELRELLQLTEFGRAACVFSTVAMAFFRSACSVGKTTTSKPLHEAAEI